ncbi:FAS1-like dehydratase domain-containing protein [Pseudogemmobacter humi]|uniref:MaoC like domain protein n=1 Tax=Pseudogemmobacter humi TaxID=2483812 RepID=A0A3P5WLU1_9RHOB|nr:MaoC family dehydratase N-terminal domain-containing protein [Pseudogemmobacter humi]VDC22658.1 MaoC like domain protein [Pseudogemmobacter humi]
MNGRPEMETVTDLVTPRLIAGLRAVLDQEGDDPARLPQCGHWALCPPPVTVAATGADGHLRPGGFLPDTGLPRRMWASGEVEFRHPIRAGMTVTRHSVVSGITEKTGKSGRMVFVTVLHRLTAAERLLISERQTIVYRAAPNPAPPRDMPAAGETAVAGAEGAAPRAAALSALRADQEADFIRTVLPDEIMLFRYSALTWNSHRIHYDRPYATEGESYPGLVVQGPLTASLLADLVARQIGPDRLRSFSFRGLAPAFCGRALRLSGVVRGETVALQASGPDGGLVMTAEGKI